MGFFFTLSYFISQFPPTRFPLITAIRMCHFLPSCASPWMAFLAGSKGQKIAMTHNQIRIILLENKNLDLLTANEQVLTLDMAQKQSVFSLQREILGVIISAPPHFQFFFCSIFLFQFFSFNLLSSGSKFSHCSRYSSTPFERSWTTYCCRLSWA